MTNDDDQEKFGEQRPEDHEETERERKRRLRKESTFQESVEETAADDQQQSYRDQNRLDDSRRIHRDTIIPREVRRRGDAVDKDQIGNTEADHENTFLDDDHLTENGSEDDEIKDADGRPISESVNSPRRRRLLGRRTDNDRAGKSPNSDHTSSSDDDSPAAKDDSSSEEDPAKKALEPLNKANEALTAAALGGKRRIDPVTEAQKNNERKNKANQALKPKSVKKKRSADADDSEDDSLSGSGKKSDKKKKDDDTLSGGSSSSSSGGGTGAAAMLGFGEMSRTRKEAVFAVVAGIALLFSVIVVFPTGGSESSFEDAAPAIIAGAAQDDENNRDTEEAAAVANQCFANSPSEDSALQATGGGLYAPGDSDPVAEVSNYDADQVMHAQEVVAVGKENGISEKGITTGLLVAQEESRFINMANNGAGENGPLQADQDPAEIKKSMDSPFSEGLPSDNGFGHGGDHGSMGIFQQQYPWWGDGTVESLMNPRRAALAFFERLKTFDYNSMEPAMAGQKVQASYDSSGNNYRRHQQAVDALYSKIKDTEKGYNWKRYGGSGGDPKPSGVSERALSIDMNQGILLAQDDDDSSGGDSAGSKKLEANKEVFNEDNMETNTVRGGRIVAKRWSGDIKNIYGFRAGDNGDHGSGRAADVMIEDYKGADEKIGDEIADFFIENADKLDVEYVIWKQRIYQPSVGDSWQPMEDRGSDNENHFNHVHISFKPSDKYDGSEVSDIDASAGSGGSSDDAERDSGASADDLSTSAQSTSSGGGSCNTLDRTVAAGSNDGEDIIKRDENEEN